MKKEHKNELFNFIIKSQFAIEDFTISEWYDGNYSYTKLEYKESGYKFTFYTPSDDFDSYFIQYIRFNPGMRMSERIPKEGFMKFLTSMGGFNIWFNEHLKEYDKEQNEIDLWGEYKKGNKLL